MAAALGGHAKQQSPHSTFGEFITRYGRQYSSPAEQERRRLVFEANVRNIERLNSLPDGSAVFMVNEFADMTATEFKAAFRMDNSNLQQKLADRNAAGMRRVSLWPHADAPPPPADKNWFLTATTPIRNQGKCGSCWAFSTVEQIESDWFLSGKAGGQGKPQALSMQQVIDCDHDEAYGCAGTYAGGGSGFDFVIQNGGLASEAAYPYTSGQTGKSSKCRTGVAIAGGRIRNHSYAIKPCDLPWDDCDAQDEDGVVRYVGSKGPLAICVNAHNWQFYHSGVATASLCGGHDHASLDHCVQLVGYSGYDARLGARASGASGAYWIVRNSWAFSNGSAWGQDGLIHLSMGNNTCGVVDVPSFAVI